MADITLTINEENILVVTVNETTVLSGGGGVTDHGALTGLSDDDHPQYHNDTRGDVRYYVKADVDTAIGVVQTDIDNHEADTANPHNVTKTQVGLGNVDNTSDVNKPISTLTQSALDLKADLVGGKVPSAQLPSFVDDVLEFANFAAFPVTGETDKIYVAIDTNIVYRWSGSAYVEISSSLALGETSSTAYRGDRGKTAYDHSQITGNPHGTTASDVGLGNVDNTSDANKPVSTAQATAIAVVQSDVDTHEADTTNPHAVTKSQVGLSNVDNTSDANKPVSTAQAAADAAVLSSAQSYADGLVVGLWDDRGSFDASGGAYPSSGGSGSAGVILKGDAWTISVAGTLPTGQVVEVGDVIRALINTPGNTQANWAITQNNIGYVAENQANKSTTTTLGTSNTLYPTQNAVKTYVDAAKIPNVLTGGTGSAYTATYSPATTLTNLTIISFVAHAQNTVTNPTINPNSLGAVTMTMTGGDPIPVGMIQAGGFYILTYVSGTTTYELANPAITAALLGLGTSDSPQFTAINLGHASDTTIARSGAGDITVEGNAIYRAGGTDVPVADGGTGSSTAGGARTNLGFTKPLINYAVSTLNTIQTGTTTIPFDDTIPQNTEGDEYLTVSITPSATTNRLVIRALFWVSNSTGARTGTIALFQDSTANALFAQGFAMNNATFGYQLSLLYEMQAGTTSATTFKIRIGTNTSGTMSINGVSGGRIYGGASVSILQVEEYAA